MKLLLKVAGEILLYLAIVYLIFTAGQAFTI